LVSFDEGAVRNMLSRAGREAGRRVVRSRAAALSSAPGLTVGSINPSVLNAQYAVRGELVLRAAQIKAALRTDPASAPVKKVLECNIGNPQAVGQQPLTFSRQVHALLAYPSLLAMPEAAALFAPDAIARAREYMAAIPEGIGAYSESQGFAVVRQQVADFITERDGHPAVKENIFLTDGASKGVEFLLKLMLRGASDGVLVPIPQYPLYSACLTLASAQLLRYELDEAAGWSLPMSELEASLAKAEKEGVAARGLVVINPGNPTGNSLPRANMEEVVRFCTKHGLVLMADEVYQENIYQDANPFVSFKKVACEMGDEAAGLQLVSFHSVSKGFLGECGMRGGYFELHGFDPAVQAQLLKLVSIGLCSNTMGQIAVGLMVRPPKAGEASHEVFATERGNIMASLKRRATKLVDGLNQMEGVSCNQPQGSMYAFPSITLPDKAVAAAEKAGKAADTFYALALLEETGIVVVPGSGFGQKHNTWHFRTTFLPPEEDMESVIEQMATFHKGFLATYA